MKENTYTFTARNAERPEQIVTFTLHDHSMSVGMADPLEQAERVWPLDRDGDENVEEGQPNLWLRPLAVSLLERGTGPFRLAHTSARSKDERLHVSTWFRAGGLGLIPITLIDGPVDNPEAAQAFADEVHRRKAEVSGPLGLLGVLNYWITWALAGAMFFGLLGFWRARGEAD